MDLFYGNYFDGASSKPHFVEISINSNFLLFEHQNSSLRWDLEHCEISIEPNHIEIKQIDTDEALVIDHPKEFLKKHPSISSFQKKGDRFYHTLTNLNLGLLMGLCLLTLTLIYIGNKYLMPTVAEKVVRIIPKSIDKSLGDSSFKTILYTAKIDSIRSEQLDQFTQELNLNTKDLNFYVINSDIVNAFCLPNGTIVIYSGLLDLLENQDELAGLIGHEIAHYNKRHSMKAISRDLAGLFIISLLTNNTTGIVDILMENAHQLESLSYSRKFEEEADEEAFLFMKDNKINPDGLKTLFEKLSNLEKIELPEFLNTHPNSENRAITVEQRIKETPYPILKHQKLRQTFNQLKKY